MRYIFYFRRLKFACRYVCALGACVYTIHKLVLFIFFFWTHRMQTPNTCYAVCMCANGKFCVLNERRREIKKKHREWSAENWNAISPRKWKHLHCNWIVVCGVLECRSLGFCTLTQKRKWKKKLLQQFLYTEADATNEIGPVIGTSFYIVMMCQ